MSDFMHKVINQLFLPAMLIGTIDSNHFLTFLVSLALGYRSVEPADYFLAQFLTD